jgi:protein-S-isoprenylcysteine O-methyltransferase Ste14
VLFFSLFMVLLPWGVHQLVPTKIPLSDAVGKGLGAILFITGLTIWLLCLDAFSRRGEGTPLPFDAPRKLVTDGLFGVVRNPIMLGELLVIWSEVLIFASAGILIYAALITLSAHLLVVHVEEPELRARFGESYESYCRSVPRWLPRWGSSTGKAD